ncbi:MAG: hypothetical protein Q9M94_02120 [Candidatus Gracilibacteria bacterium]|nr:hypothetical protein [Candidatus Gracilibacteria bacterium]MDQ7023334.1 hypothetical protein [Candidatus Gracilibacteria bacterium]
MKKILNNKIINIAKSDKFDNKFSFSVLNYDNNQKNIKIIYLSDLLEQRKNIEMLEKSEVKSASYSNVYSPEDELYFFKEVFENAIKNNKKTHIIGITLKEEVEILENYYNKLGFFNEEINCFEVDYSKVLVSASVKIENLMWRGSDYKKMGKKIFFNPPIRESGQVKAMFKGINRGSISGIKINSPIIPFNKGDEDIINSKIINFFQKQILEENIISIILAKVLYFNLVSFGLKGEELEMIIEY